VLLLTSLRLCLVCYCQRLIDLVHHLLHALRIRTAPSEVAKSIEPTCTIIQERVPLEKGCVKSVCVMNKLLKVFQRNLGSEGRASQILEVIGTVGPGANDIAIKLPQLVRNALRQPPTATGYFVPVFPGSHVVIVGESKDTCSARFVG
jgi:hypothetical protein